MIMTMTTMWSLRKDRRIILRISIFSEIILLYLQGLWYNNKLSPCQKHAFAKYVGKCYTYQILHPQKLIPTIDGP